MKEMEREIRNLSKIDIGLELFANRTFDIVKQYSSCNYDLEHPVTNVGSYLEYKDKQCLLTIILSHSGKTNIILRQKTKETYKMAFDAYLIDKSFKDYKLRFKDLSKINIIYCGNCKFLIEFRTNDSNNPLSTSNITLREGDKLRIGCRLNNDIEEILLEY